WCMPLVGAGLIISNRGRCDLFSNFEDAHHTPAGIKMEDHPGEMTAGIDIWENEKKLQRKPVSMSDAPAALYQSGIKSLPLINSGKVRDIYEVDADHLLIVTTDRISAFDVIMPDPIPGKGAVL